MRSLNRASRLGALGFRSASGRFRFLCRSFSGEVNLGVGMGSAGTGGGAAASSNGLILVFSVLVVARQDRNNAGRRWTSSAPSPRFWRLWGDDAILERLAFGGHGDNLDQSDRVRCSAELIRSG